MESAKLSPCRRDGPRKVAALRQRCWLSAWQRYYAETRRPLHCLLFLLPILALHEVGLLWAAPAGLPEPRLVAHSLIRELLGWFGVSGSWVPAAVVVAVLVVWQVASRQPWRVRLSILPVMAIESVVLTLPLLVLVKVLLTATFDTPSAWTSRIAVAVGAGVYEELVFRLAVIAALLYVQKRWLRLPEHVRMPIAIFVAALAFAACHLAPIGSATPNWPLFLTLLVAGVYLGLVYVGRGIGLAAGCHAAFNVITILNS